MVGSKVNILACKSHYIETNQEISGDEDLMFKWIDIASHKRLWKRNKKSLLKPKEVIYLIKIISANPDDLSLIKKTYHLSDSIFYRLKWMTKNGFREFQEFESKWFKENTIDQAICSTL